MGGLVLRGESVFVLLNTVEHHAPFRSATRHVRIMARVLLQISAYVMEHTQEIIAKHLYVPTTLLASPVNVLITFTVSARMDSVANMD